MNVTAGSHGEKSIRGQVNPSGRTCRILLCAPASWEHQRWDRPIPHQDHGWHSGEGPAVSVGRLHVLLRSRLISTGWFSLHGLFYTRWWGGGVETFTDSWSMINSLTTHRSYCSLCESTCSLCASDAAVCRKRATWTQISVLVRSHETVVDAFNKSSHDLLPSCIYCSLD